MLKDSGCVEGAPYDSAFRLAHAKVIQRKPARLEDLQRRTEEIPIGVCPEIIRSDKCGYRIIRNVIPPVHRKGLPFRHVAVSYLRAKVNPALRYGNGYRHATNARRPLLKQIADSSHRRIALKDL